MHNWVAALSRANSRARAEQFVAWDGTCWWKSEAST